MYYLLLSIVSSSLIYITFKLVNKYRIKIFPVIITNYIIASITGFLFREKDFSLNDVISADWFYISIIIGILFISMFYLIGLSTQKTGITVTSISTKMSVVFPMLFSIIYYAEDIYLLKVLGMTLAITAIIFASLKNKETNPDIKNIIFPIALFIGMGIVDSSVKYNQAEYLQDTGALESTTIIFAVSAIIGIAIQLIFNLKKNKEIRLSTLFLGTLLGLSNFGSLYFLILALNSRVLDSSIIFAVNNTAIIIISAMAGKSFFKEKLSMLNWIGVSLSIIAIIALSI